MEISKTIRDDISTLLTNIEREHNVTIIVAVESGSRAWGFPSKDSDYDIRFIYHKPAEDYLSCFEKRDVIDNIFEGDLDAAGWDLTKTLRLMRGGNAQSFEWLNCQSIYQEQSQKVKILRDFADTAFCEKPVFSHYLGMVKKKVFDEKYTKHPKSFLYALRALLSAKWVAEKNGSPPVEFETLKCDLVKNTEVAGAIDTLINDKLLIGEGDDYKIREPLLIYLQEEFAELKALHLGDTPKRDQREYDAVFKSILNT